MYFPGSSLTSAAAVKTRLTLGALKPLTAHTVYLDLSGQRIRIGMLLVFLQTNQRLYSSDCGARLTGFEFQLLHQELSDLR